MGPELRLFGWAVCVTVAATAAGTTGAAAPRGDDTLRVCLLDRDLPRADKSSGEGFDLELTQRLAERLGRRWEPVWSASGSPFSEIEESEIPLDALAEGECDLVASVPGPTALEGNDDELALSRPYYGAAFELVTVEAQRNATSPRTPRGIDDLGSAVIAVRLQTVAHFAVHRHGLRWLAAPTTTEVLGLLESGEATLALVWGPTAAAAGVATDPSWQPPSYLRWNLHLAVRRSDSSLENELDRALDALLADGTVAAILARFGLARPPFNEVFDPKTFAAAAAVR